MPEENENFGRGVEELTKSVLKLSSLRSAFWRGIFFGLGSAIGASVVAAIVIGLLYKIAHLFTFLPGVGK